MLKSSSQPSGPLATSTIPLGGRDQLPDAPIREYRSKDITDYPVLPPKFAVKHESMITDNYLRYLQLDCNILSRRIRFSRGESTSKSHSRIYNNLYPRVFAL